VNGDTSASRSFQIRGTLGTGYGASPSLMADLLPGRPVHRREAVSAAYEYIEKEVKAA
jgi:hypothetical protein